MKKIASALPETEEACVGKRITGRCVVSFIASTAESTFSKLRFVEPPTMNPSVPTTAVCVASSTNCSESILPGSNSVK